MTNILLILVSGIFVQNFILSKFLGICPFLGVSKQIETAVGMGIAVTFVMAMASAITYVVQYAILDPLGLGYLQTIAFILVIAALVQLVEMIIQKTSPVSYTHLDVYKRQSVPCARFWPTRKRLAAMAVQGCSRNSLKMKWQSLSI